MRIVFFLLTSIISVTAAGQSRADNFFEQANKAVDDGNAQKAIKLYLSAREEYLKEKNFNRVLTCTQNVAMYYQDTGDGAGAEKLILETVERIPKNSTETLSIHASLQDNLGYTYLYLLNKPHDALNAYTEALKFYNQAGLENSSNEAFELVNRAAVYNTLYNFEKSASDLKKAISIYEQLADTPVTDIAGYYQQLALVFNKMHRYTDALQSIEKSMELIKTKSEPELKGAILNDWGVILMDSGDVNAALEKFELAQSLYEKHFGKDADHYATTLINIASVNRKMGDLDASLGFLKEALSIYEATPPIVASSVIDVLILMSNTSNDLGMFEESENQLEAAQEIAKSNYGENSVMQAEVLFNAGIMAYNKAAFDESLTYFFKALTLLEENAYPEDDFYAMIYTNVGQAYDELGEVALALSYKNKALDLYLKIFGPAHATVAKAYGDIGLTYEIKEDYDRAIDYLQQSVALLVKDRNADRDNLGRDYLNIGLMYFKKGNVQEGVTYLEKARLIFDRYAKHESKAMVYNRLAYGYQQLHQPAKERECILKALQANVYKHESIDFDDNPQSAECISMYELNLSYTAKIDYYTRVGDKASLIKAEKLLELSGKLLDSKLLSLASSKDRLKLSQLNAFFTEAALHWVEKYYQLTNDPLVLEKAFYFSERSKANELLADIQLSNVSYRGESKKTAGKYKQLQKKLTTLQQQSSSAYAAGNQSLIAKLKAQEFDLTKEMGALELEMQKLSPVFKKLSEQREHRSWSQLKMEIPPGAVLVSYVIADSAKYILIGNQSKLVLKTIPPKTNIEKLVRLYTNQIRFQSSMMGELREKLTTVLWAPVEEALKEFGSISEIILVPEGPLLYLPFESLGKENYLIEKYTLRYHYSAALLATANQKNQIHKPSSIAMAPVFEDEETNFVLKSCERFVKAASAADSTTRAFTVDGQYITPLPATEKEVVNINQLHADKGFPLTYFLNADASEERIKQGELGKYDYIHLATHGFVNTSYPELSGLLLSPNKNSTEDGILYAGEIINLNLQSDLVTLSACETALGKRIEGEGVRGLTTSFLLAGSRCVIASLWKVADESTSMLMIDFYSDLLSGKSKATALRNAKLKLIASGNYNHPYYWAPFIQVGAN